MDENALGFTSYWRNSLADAESGKAVLNGKTPKIHSLAWDSGGTS
ncbi:superfamily I DNA helicase [Escherichia coli]|uniref:Superfamily I DNA helicase n=1 Tax=Escherichia coli TaxID=562 RepID=A0A376NZ42_ECOLX|nr:superfamily I DNA helicase [Escherichia coli]